MVDAMRTRNKQQQKTTGRYQFMMLSYCLTEKKSHETEQQACRYLGLGSCDG